MSDQITIGFKQIAALLEGTYIKECTHDIQEVILLLIKLNIGYLHINKDKEAIFMTHN